MNKMQKVNFEKYSDKHLHFYDLNIPQLLNQAISMKNGKEIFDLVDLGCGDGNLIYNLKSEGLLTKVDSLVGVDLSPKRIEVLKENIKDVTGIVSDASHVSELKDNSFDIVIASQIIEHLPNDAALIQEIKRLLKPDGLAFISSVIKQSYGIYFYRINGEFRIDPTHLREYSSKQEFIDIIERNELKVWKFFIKKIKYPLIDLLIRFLVNKKMLRTDQVRHLYTKNNLLIKFRIFSIPIIGYYSIETLCQKKEERDH